LTVSDGVSKNRLITVVRVTRYVAPGMDMRGWLIPGGIDR
jgi:hypothetical protein